MGFQTLKVFITFQNEVYLINSQTKREKKKKKAVRT